MTYSVKIDNNFVEKPQTFDTLIVCIQFHIKLIEIRYCDKNYCCVISTL